MSTVATQLTVEQYGQLPEERTARTELIRGEIVAMGNAAWPHERVKANSNEHLVVYVAGNRIGKVFSETMFAIQSTEGLIPDVSLLLNHRLRPADPDQVFQGAPDLAVEVVSSETAANLEWKVSKYLEGGSRAVWIAYPRTRVVCRRLPNGESQYLREGQYLEEPELLPGFRVPVAAFFEGI